MASRRKVRGRGLAPTPVGAAVETGASASGRDGPEGQPSSKANLVPRARYCLQLASKDSAKAILEYAVGQMVDRGLNVKLMDAKYLIVSPKEMEVLTLEAENHKYLKALKNSDEEVVVFSRAVLDQVKPSDGNHVFTQAEEMKLLYHVLQSVTIDPKVLEKLKVCVGEENGFLTRLKSSNPPVLEDAFPMHESTGLKELARGLKMSFLPTNGLPLKEIRKYFGEDVTFYFSWMQFYAKWIWCPALCGLLMWLLRPSGVTVDNDPYLPFYSIFMAVWGVLFLIFWQRQSAVNSYNWNTHSHSAVELERPEFHGVLSPDPVTRKPRLYYPSWKRRLWYVFSFTAMLPLLFVGVCVMALSLNLNGYIKDKNSPIYVASLSKYAAPGGIFAADTPYYGFWLIPTIAHSIIVNIINSIYSKVAETTTDLENHRTVNQWYVSMVIKRVLFECLDCFMPLFYIAFYQLDVVVLKAEIISLFMSDEIRRVVMETVIPLAKTLVFGKAVFRSKAEILDTVLTEYEQFDDYLEMVVQFGYITLFASACPLGATVTLLFLFVEVRSDLFKLLNAYRRPFPMRASNIGVWFTVMKTMVFLSIITNSAILGFSSEQLMQWVPSLFSRDAADGDQVMVAGSGRYIVGIVFGFEHLLLLVALALQWTINPVPKWVRVAIGRQKYLRKQRTGLQLGMDATSKKGKTD